MGTWSLSGIALMIGLFLAVFAFILAQIDVTNPLTGEEANIWGIVWEWLTGGETSIWDWLF